MDPLIVGTFIALLTIVFLPLMAIYELRRAHRKVKEALYGNDEALIHGEARDPGLDNVLRGARALGQSLEGNSEPSSSELL
jgi:hypothetical protein